MPTRISSALKVWIRWLISISHPSAARPGPIRQLTPAPSMPFESFLLRRRKLRSRGYKPGRFSFNVKGVALRDLPGRWDYSHRDALLPDVYVPCEVCRGKRYNRETLEIRYKGKNIADVLAMRVDEALEFFKNIPKISRKLQTLHDVGLGYIELGQPAPLAVGGRSSAGEAGHRAPAAAATAAPCTSWMSRLLVFTPMM